MFEPRIRPAGLQCESMVVYCYIQVYIQCMTIRERVLEAALLVCRGRKGWVFQPAEVVTALPDLNPGSVRTHVMSRCCVNAPAHHSHRWPYFRRVRRGAYEILPRLRRQPAPRHRRPSSTRDQPVIQVDVREETGTYIAKSAGLPRTVAAASLDALAADVRRLAAQARTELGASTVRLRIDLDVEDSDPVLEAYEKDIDRTLIRGNFRLSVEERLRKLQGWMKATAEIRGIAPRAEQT